jgi:hypothetical protein
MTERTKKISSKILEKYDFAEYDLPTINTKKNKTNLKSFFKDNSNDEIRKRKQSKIYFSSESNKNILNHKQIEQKDDNQNPNQQYLDKKIIQLINCYKDLKFSEKKPKFKRVSFNQDNSHNNSKDHNINILSKSLTKAYKISEQPDKEGVKKLDEWDKNNLAQIYGNSNMIYNILYNYYVKTDDYKKIYELKYYKNIIESNGDDVGNIINVKSTNNKIIKDFLNLRIKEQTYILKNSIAHSRFQKTLLFIKDKKLALNLGLDGETLAEIKKPEEKTGYNYEKVIKEKDKNEVIKKEELVNILIKIFNKKIEKSKKEKKQSEMFEKINQTVLKYQSQILKIQYDIDAKKELYDKIHDTEFEKEKMVEKMNRLQIIKYESDIEVKKQQELKKELNQELKELTTVKEHINEELDIYKHEIAYMKLVYINLVKNQRNYYLDLLKKGYDVRGEGLIWVVKRLLEIQTKLEYHHFPKFLDNNQIDYIIDMANLSLEEIQLKTILKIIEKKRDDIQKSVNNKVMNTIVELSRIKNRHRSSIFTLEMEKIRNALKEEESGTKIFESFQKIYRKYKSIFASKIMQKDEDIKIQKIIGELKSSLIERGGKTTTENFQQLTGILDYLNSNKESKDYLEILLLIKFRLSYIHKLRENLKEEQIIKYRQEISNNNNNRFFNAELSLRLDLVKSALFGNKF